MRFMMIVKASKRWEAGKMPSEELRQQPPGAPEKTDANSAAIEREER